MTVLGLDVAWGKLGEAAAVSAVIGLGVLLIAAVAVASSLRAADSRGTGGGSTATFGAVTVGCVVALAAVVVYGIYTIAA